VPGPTGWHLAYLAALAVAAGSFALVRDARRAVAALAVALVAATGAVVAQVKADPGTPTDEVIAAVAARLPYECERHTGVTYCAYPGYRPWIRHWRLAVEPVVAGMPEAARASLPPVRQTFASMPLPGDAMRWEVRTSLWWGRNSGEASFRNALAVFYADAVVGLPTDHGMTVALTTEGHPCSVAGKARAVVATWLAAQSLPDGLTQLRNHLDMGFIDLAPRDLDTVAGLLALPRERVTAALARDWNRVTAADTPTDALAGLGLPVAPRGPSDPPPSPPCPAPRLPGGQ
jgi:hypothetical protein